DGGAALAAGLAYLTSPSGLRILDTSMPGMPMLGDASITGEPTDVSVAGNLAALATDSGLSIVDITDPSAPFETDESSFVGGLERVVLDGDIAYAISATRLSVFSVVDPGAIVVIDEIAMTGLTDLDAHEGRVWVTRATGAATGTVFEYNASNPSDLVKTAEHSLPGGMPSVTVTTETAFVGLTDPNWGGSAIKAFDITEPGTLYYTNWIDAGRWMASDVVADDGILIATGEGGVQQLGVFEPSMPYQMGFAPTPGNRAAVDAELITLSSVGGGTTFMRYDPVSFRTFGGTRFDTAIAMSQTFDSSEYVVLATGRSYPDALAGVPLAYALDAPILLTERDYIPDDVVAEIQRLGATRAIVLGGTTAMSDNIVAQLRSMGMAGSAIERISGATRYETAKAIALRLQQVYGAGTIDKAFVATGLNFPDALAAAGAAAKAGCPILLVKPGDSNVAALAAVASLGIADTVIVGGTAVVPANVAAMFPSPERLAGNNRYATAVHIANWSLADSDTAFDPTNLFVVTGTNFPDALACGVVAAGSDAPTLLVGSDPPPETLGFIRDNAGAITRVDIVGGDAAVSSAVERWLVNYVR
ncbi:MAG: cell wall-binding repeat-containing protein, partial [Actinomycetota bacterium]|nr:cell wall-binding repeat-containing protein [Actinomycetota bacterium]